MLKNRTLLLFGLAVSLTGCGGEIDDGGMSTTRTEEGLSGCHGKAASSIPSSGSYYLTSFGFTPSDDGLMSCGEKTLHGTWYYAASRQRYGCGSRIKIEANGKCVVAETDDYGPDVCVEAAAGRPIIDASPLVSQHLFGTRSAGWSDRFAIEVSEVANTTPLGPCGSSSTPPPSTPPPASTAHCYSSTLGKTVDAGTCVQSRSNGVWYQCGEGGWETPVANGAGPVGPCSAEYAL